VADMTGKAFSKPEQKMKDLLIVDTPTSLDVAGAVLQAIGAMYPAAVMNCNEGHVLHIQVAEGTVAREIDWDSLYSEYPLDDDLID
jgi:hypothetical protein